MSPTDHWRVADYRGQVAEPTFGGSRDEVEPIA
ncbi:MAG: hypothetical protein QOI55_2066 [Actinomycetota bacterium]|nr:hypothetical protein [Actinomycetota bacterium]